MTWYETMDEKLARLRAELAQLQDDLIDAEADLADAKADIEAFEYEYTARVGEQIDRLAALESDVKQYLDRIREMRNKKIFGTAHVPVEEQYRRIWQQPSKPKPKKPPEPPSPATEKEIKKLYRKLARQAHPDLAKDDADRAYRTDRMAAINDAYAARSMTELMALARELGEMRTGTPAESGRTAAEMVSVLEEEIARCRRRLREIDLESQELHNGYLVELMLEVKFARRRGRDVLGEMATEIARKIARKEAERDMLKSQFDSMGLGGGRIRPDA